MGKIFFLITLLFCSSAWAYRLTVIQGVSREKQTFVTRLGKKDGVVQGKKATFNTDNVSFIAKAISVSREFTQWEIENHLTDVPFKRGDVITYYDTTEHLWALAPAEVMSKYIKNERYMNRKGLSVHSYLSRTYAEATTGVEDPSTVRGGYEVDGLYVSEISKSFSWGIGGRFSKETIQADAATLINDRVMALLEVAYFMEPIVQLNHSRIVLTGGVGYGLSQTVSEDIVSSGQARILPQLKVGISIPINHRLELRLETGIESINTEEKFEDGTKQISQVNNAKVGIGLTRYINI